MPLHNIAGKLQNQAYNGRVLAERVCKRQQRPLSRHQRCVHWRLRRVRAPPCRTPQDLQEADHPVCHIAATGSCAKVS